MVVVSTSMYIRVSFLGRSSEGTGLESKAVSAITENRGRSGRTGDKRENEEVFYFLFLFFLPSKGRTPSLTLTSEPPNNCTPTSVTQTLGIMNNVEAYNEAHLIQLRDACDFVEEFSDELGEMYGDCIDIGCGPGTVSRDLLLPKMPSSTMLTGEANYARSKNMFIGWKIVQ